MPDFLFLAFIIKPASLRGSEYFNHNNVPRETQGKVVFRKIAVEIFRDWVVGIFSGLKKIDVSLTFAPGKFSAFCVICWILGAVKPLGFSFHFVLTFQGPCHRKLYEAKALNRQPVNIRSAIQYFCLVE